MKTESYIQRINQIRASFDYFGLLKMKFKRSMLTDHTAVYELTVNDERHVVEVKSDNIQQLKEHEEILGNVLLNIHLDEFKHTLFLVDQKVGSVTFCFS